MSDVRVKDYPIKKLTGSVIVDRIRSYVETSMRKKGVYVDTEIRKTKTGNEVVIHGRGFHATIRESDDGHVHVVLTAHLAPLTFHLVFGVPVTIVDEREIDDALAKLMRSRYARLRLIRNRGTMER